ncbi:hypothetical protein [Cellulomonas chengniuliangii]|uniref:Uncharacterized protein n=1 Tax=Cellulomonas chengniuliangii TaxID=2968084 RepID=A0ABY5L066_9CELL|nr:hypothetical protein [Cellulomonas chengniuliangii]MCC2307934.1 hypothetical protein [Cellulomonas chengniuliangii]MCC2318456.1 hypothetical protein [Cellulomonas chengniuliangii]UUI75318.1 hypothetical protein NP064_16400 [Cellulomonas chengniuliangii]
MGASRSQPVGTAKLEGRSDEAGRLTSHDVVILPLTADDVRVDDADA